MTRINAGILPAELCDRHLIACYRELPRMRALAIARWARYRGTGPRPEAPTLGTGHMAYFLPFGEWLRIRWESLCGEMRFRGFHVGLAWREYPASLCGTLPAYAEAHARPLLVARIRERLQGMPRASWTMRTAPDWAGRISC